MERKQFLKSATLGALFFGLPDLAKANITEIETMLNTTKIKGSLIDHKVPALGKTRVGIIGMGNRGQVLIQMFDWLIKNNKAEIVAICDLKEDKVKIGNDYLKKTHNIEAKGYFGNENEWEKLVKRDDIDLILICTPWEWHTKMCIFAMENKKHAASEVPIAYTLDDCYKLISVAEKTKMHCAMIENCNYNGEELWLLNMINKGVFGELNHAEGAYIHDLRALFLSETYYENQWRLQHHLHRNGNFYPTHGLGPIATYMDIGYGDNYNTLVSMSSKEYSLSEAAKSIGRDLKIVCGDMSTTLIKTQLGRTIMLQMDTHTARPYSRINTLTGSKAVHMGYPSRLFIADADFKNSSHKWLSDEEYKNYREKYDHPLWAKLKKQISENEVGHGGMDFVMIYRLVECLNQGLSLDFSIYDSVNTTSIVPLSELSVAKGSMPIKIPDFTGNTWKAKRPSPFLRDI